MHIKKDANPDYWNSECECPSCGNIVRHYDSGEDWKKAFDTLREYVKKQNYRLKFLEACVVAIQTALGNGSNEDLWRPGYTWLDEACRVIRNSAACADLRKEK